MDIFVYLLLGGSFAINVAVSVQVYRLHKSLLDLKEKLNVEDSRYDAAVRDDIDHELGIAAERRAQERAERKVRKEAEDNALPIKSTIFDDEDDIEVTKREDNRGPVYFSDAEDLSKKIDKMESLSLGSLSAEKKKSDITNTELIFDEDASNAANSTETIEEQTDVVDADTEDDKTVSENTNSVSETTNDNNSVVKEQTVTVEDTEKSESISEVTPTRVAGTNPRRRKKRH